MQRRSYRQVPGGRLAGTVVAVLALVGCAGTPPAEPPKIERLTGSAAGPSAQSAPVGLDEIVAATKNGQTPAQIIDMLDAVHTHHHLTASRIAALIEQGVSLQVLDHLVETDRRRIFDDAAADSARREHACQDRLEQEARQCRLQSMLPCWPGHPFTGCWPPHAGFPYWRGF